jgi:hypothetical protein
VILSGVTEGSLAHAEQRGGKMTWSALSNILRQETVVTWKRSDVEHYEWPDEFVMIGSEACVLSGEARNYLCRAASYS